VEWEHEAGGGDENQTRGARSFFAPHPTDAKDASVEWGIRGLGWPRKKTKTGRAICYPPVPFALPFGAIFPEHSCVTPTYGDAFERRPISCGICAGIVKGGKRGQIQKVPQEQKQILPLRCTQGQDDNRG
jgi:hypothetical protein